MLEQSMNGRVNTLGKITCIQTCECFALRSHSPNRTWVNGGGVCHGSICRGWIYIYMLLALAENHLCCPAGCLPVCPSFRPFSVLVILTFNNRHQVLRFCSI